METVCRPVTDLKPTTSDEFPVGADFTLAEEA